MVITGPTRNRLFALPRTVGSNPTLSAIASPEVMHYIECQDENPSRGSWIGSATPRERERRRSHRDRAHSTLSATLRKATNGEPLSGRSEELGVNKQRTVAIWSSPNSELETPN